MQTITIEQCRYQPHQWLMLKGNEVVGYFAAPNAKEKAEQARRLHCPDCGSPASGAAA